MASETVLASQQPSISSVQSLMFPNSKLAALPTKKNNVEATEEGDCNRLASRAPRSSVESDESSDEMGQLVIDLDNDDGDKMDNNVQRSGDLIPRDYQESPESTNSDTGGSASTEDVNNKAVGGDVTLPYEKNFDHLNKNNKAKTKKSAKLNKTKTHSQSLQLERAEVAKVTAFSDGSHVIEPRLPVPSAGVSLDHSKKAKSSKSKSHKKQNRLAEKSHTSSSVIKSESSTKAKIKSKHMNKGTSERTSAYITNTGDHNMLTGQDDSTVSPALTLANKLDSSNRRFISINDSDKPVKGRTPSRTALVPSATNQSVKNDPKAKNLAENEQYGRKRHKRRQAPSFGDRSSRDNSNDSVDQDTEATHETYEVHPKRLKSDQEVKKNLLSASKAGESLDQTRLYTDSKLNSNDSVSSQTSEMLDKQHELPNTRKILSNYQAPATTSTSGSTAASSPTDFASNAAEVNGKSRAKSSVSSKSKNDYKPKKNSSPSRQSVGTTTSDIGVMTEPDALAPCEPGTSVTLNGIVWQETETGVLVVNVTWRNRTYVGTLLDATKNDWDPPRLLDAESDFESRGRLGRSQRLRGGVSDNTRKSRSRGIIQYSLDDIKRSPSTTKRKNKNVDSDAASDSSATRLSSKRSRITPSRGNKDSQAESSGAGNSSSPCSSPDLIECPHPSCCKRYRNVDGLKYHQSHAHNDSPTSDPEKADEKLPDSIKTEQEPVEKSNEHFDKSTNNAAPEADKSKPSARNDLNKDLKPPVDSELKISSDGTDSTPKNDMNSSNMQEPSKIPSTNLKTTSVTDRRLDSSYPFESSQSSIATSSDDYESAQAVQTLLQLQDSNVTSLPGLSATTCVPNPAVTAQSRPDPSLLKYNFHYPLPPELLRSHSMSLSSSSRHSPYNLSTPKPHPSTKPPTSLGSKPPHFTEHFGPKPGLSALGSEHSSSNRNSAAVSTVFSNGIRSSATIFKEGSNIVPAHSMFTGSSAINRDSILSTSGHRMVKGKIAPVPVVNDAALNDARFPVRKTDEKGSKNETTPATIQNKYYLDAEQKSRSAGNPSFSASSIVGSSLGLNGQAQKSEANSVRSPVPSNRETGSHLVSQGYLGKKMSGIILPVSSSSQNGNNVTVTGTFHPHPDPHKPQVSTSISDKNRTEIQLSASDLSNRNNNNKLPRSQSSISKPNSAVPTPPTSVPVSKLDPKMKFLHPNFGLGLHDMIRIQDKVDSAIADCYSAELANKRHSKSESVVQSQSHSNDSSRLKQQASLDKTRSVEIKTSIESKSISKPIVSEPPRISPRLPNKSSADENSSTIGQSSHLSRSASPHRSSYDPAMYNHHPAFSQVMDPALLARANYPQNRQQFEMQLLQEMQKQQHFLRLQQSQVNDEKKRSRTDLAEKHGKPEQGPKNSGQVSSVFQKAHAWQQQQQHSKAPNVSSYYPANMSKDKMSPVVSVPSRATPDASNIRYQSPQPKISSTLPPPVRSHSVSQSNSFINNKGFFVKSEPLGGRGRNLSKEADHVPVPKPRSPLKVERTPDMKDIPANSKQGSIQYLPYPPIFEIRGVPPLAVPGLQPGYVFPPGAPAVFPPGAWSPIVGRQSPISKSAKPRLPVRTRSPIKEENLKSEDKVADYSYHCAGKDRKPVEASNRPFSKPSPSPESRIVKAIPTPSRKNRESPSSSSNPRAPSPPTQMHHHTHHHIHGVYQPPYPYGGAPVLASPEAVASFAMPYPKRD